MRVAAALLLALVFGSAHGQFSGSASILSDYRYRGVTRSAKKPAAQLGVTYDHPTGWYIGGFGSTVRITPAAGDSTQATGFAGLAYRISPGLSVEIGGDYSAFDEAARYNYKEFFVGVAREDSNARIHYSPKYFGFATESIYAEVNHAQALTERLRLVLHAGFFRTSSDTFYATGADRRVVDARVGLAADVDLFNIELAWVGNSRPSAESRVSSSRSSNTVVLTLSRSF